MCLNHWFRRRHSVACLTISLVTLIGVWPLCSGERPVVQNVVPKSDAAVPGANDPIRHAILSREVHREKAGTRRFKPAPETFETATNHGKKRALLVGINRYEHEPTPPPSSADDEADLRDFDLPQQAHRYIPYRRRFAERDAQVLAEELGRHGFEVRTLMGTGFFQDTATRDNIAAHLRAMQEHRSNGDVVLVAFFAYGRQVQWRDKNGQPLRDSSGNERRDVLLAPTDFRPKNAESYLSLTRMVDDLKAQGGSTLFLLDLCRDWSTLNQPGCLTGKELQGRLPRGTALLFGSTSPVPSMESSEAGGGHGLFAHRVIEGLRGDAAEMNGSVTWQGLVQAIGHHSKENSSKPSPPGIYWQCRTLGVQVTVQEFQEVRQLDSDVTLVDPRPKPQIIRAGTHEFVRIPEGTCEIGAVPDDWGADGDELPRYTVIVPSFMLSRFEVTAEQFMQFVKESGYTSSSLQEVKDFSPRTWANPGWDDYGPRHPVVNVTHLDAQAYCRWLSKKLGQTVRLPTEPEFEFAARAGFQSRFIHGNDIHGLRRVANLDGQHQRDTTGVDVEVVRADKLDCWDRTAPVGSLQPNAFGLFDMCGNVSEWTDSDYHSYGKQTRARSHLCAMLDMAVFRGADWSSDSQSARVSNRTLTSTEHRFDHVGFRIVLGEQLKPRRPAI